MSSFVSVGNKADVSGNDLLEYWEDDAATRVILLYMESFGNPRRFARIARRVSRRKPIVAVKSGRTEAGARAASSHTAALASTEAAVEALFRQTGVVRVDTVDELFDAARVFDRQPLPAGRRVAIVGNSGGPGVLAADALVAAGLTLAPLATDTRTAIAAVADPCAAVLNPIDLVASATPEIFEATLAATLSDDAVDAVHRPGHADLRRPRRGGGGHDRARRAPVRASRWWPASWRGRRCRRCCPTMYLPSPHPNRRCGPWAGRLSMPSGAAEIPEPFPISTSTRNLDSPLWTVYSRTSPPDDGSIPERSTVCWRAYRIPRVEFHILAPDADEVATVAERLGYPVVVKAAGPKILHKSDVGGVKLHLASEDDVRSAVAELRAGLGDDLQRVVVQPQVSTGVELIVGVSHDRLFGPLVMVGLGGVAVELLGDRQFRVLPVTDVDAAELIRSLRGTPLLFGYRGQPPADVEAVEDVILRVARLAADLPEIVEVDLNPVVARPDGATVLDARVRVAPPPRPTSLDARHLSTR